MRFTPPRRRAQERGSILLFATMLISFLLFSAAAVQNDAADEASLWGGQLVHANAAYLAEAGLSEGADLLQRIVFPSASVTTAQPANLTAYPTVPNGDALCADGSTCANWVLLFNGAHAFGGGTYRVAATCYPNACGSSGTINGFQIRSLAIPNAAPAATLLLESNLSANP